MRKHLTATLLIALTLIAQINWCESSAASPKDTGDRDKITTRKSRLGDCTKKTRDTKELGYELMRIVSAASPIGFELKSTEPDEQALQVFPNTAYDIMAATGKAGSLEVRYKDVRDSIVENGNDNLVLLTGDIIKIRNGRGRMDYYVVTILHTDMMAALRLRERWLYGTKAKATYYSSGGYNISTRSQPDSTENHGNTNQAVSAANPGGPAASNATNPRFRDATRKDQPAPENRAPRPNPKQ